MRVLHYISSTAAKIGGPSRFALDAGQMMADRGHAFTLLVYDASDSPPAWVTPDHASVLRSDGTSGPKVCTLPGPMVFKSRIGRKDMALIRQHLEWSDVLHLHGVFVPANVQLGRLARAMGVPYVVSCHGMLDDWSMDQKRGKKVAFMSLMGRSMLESAAAVHCTAQAEVDQSKKWFPRGREVIMPYMFDFGPYRELPGPERARQKIPFIGRGEVPVLLFLSRLHIKKGVEVLIGAAAELRRRKVACKVALAGMGDEAYVRSLQELIDRERLGEMVKLVGPVTGADKVSLYQAADLFVLPTSQENFGIVLIEALAAGTPLITTKGVDIWKDIASSGAGEIVDQAPMPLADAIQRLVSDRPLLNAMAERARPWAFATYDEDRLCKAFESLYEDCIRRTPKPRRVGRSAAML